MAAAARVVAGRGRLNAALMLVTSLWLLLALSLPVWAQDEPDYIGWEQTATKDEAVIERHDATDDQLSRMRAEVVVWRDRFMAAQSINAPRITTLKEQIAALGAPPSEGQSEAPDIAARRKELNDQLAELQAPSLRAVEAYSRADSLIKAIDETARIRQADALMHQSPSPLLPSSWKAAATEGMRIVAEIVGDVRDRTYGAAGKALVARMPIILLYLGLALGLLIYGRRWIDSLPARLGSRASDYARDAVAFIVSLGQIVIPTAGAYLLVRALDTTGLAGAWARPILVVVPIAALILFSASWLMRRFFPLTGEPPINYSEQDRKQGQFYGTALAGALALHHIAGQALLPLSATYSQGGDVVRIPMEVSEAAAGVWHLPMLLMGALLLFRLGAVLSHRPVQSSDGPDYAARVMAILGGVARLVAIISPILALVGYVTLANSILWPTTMTIALAMLVIVLQEFATDLWAIVKRDRGQSRDALAPVLIGFAMVIAALPVLALLWGATTADLAEFWTKLKQGVQLGGMRLSPGAIITFIIVFSLGYVATRTVQGTVRNSILPRTKLDAGTKNATVSGLGYVGIFLAALLAITSAGIDLSSLAIVAGALSVGIGFGLQNIVSNFVSGIILLVERPVAVGDWIQVGTAQGYVKRISVRSTQIQTFDRTDVIVPNSDLISKEVTNWTRGNLQGRVIVKVGVAYGSDTRQVQKILREIAEDQPTVLVTPPPVVVLANIGTDSLDFEIRAVISDINQGTIVQSDMRHEIIQRFADEGIDIPFAHRDVRIVNASAFVKPVVAAAPTGHAASDARRDVSQLAQIVPTGDEDEDPRITRAAASGLETAGDDGDGDGDGNGEGRA